MISAANPFAGAVGPLILAVVPLDLYAICFAQLHAAAGFPVWAACAEAFAAATIGVTLPLYLFVSWRAAAAPRSAEAEPLTACDSAPADGYGALGDAVAAPTVPSTTTVMGLV